MVRDGAEPVIGPRFARTRWRVLTMRINYRFAVSVGSFAVQEISRV